MICSTCPMWGALLTLAGGHIHLAVYLAGETMSGIGSGWRRHRAAVASNLALILAASGVVVYAVAADGYKTHRTDLNDGGIWVTSGRESAYGRVNKPIGQQDALIFAPLDSLLDIAQDGSAVVGVDFSAGRLAGIDPATAAQPEGESAAIPRDAQVSLAGGTLAVLDPARGTVRATRVDPTAGVAAVAGVDQGVAPVVRADRGAALAVTVTGTVLVLSAQTDSLVRATPRGDTFTVGAAEPLEAPIGEQIAVSAVGDVPVSLDFESGALSAVGGARAVLDAGGVLQQPGPEASEVLVATREAFLGVDVVTGALRTIADGLEGRPVAPVRVGNCVFGAWSGGQGTLVSQCGSDEPSVAYLRGDAADLIFRVNRGQVLLNDRLSGAVWNLDATTPTRVDDWEAFKKRDDKGEKDSDSEDNNVGDRRPPKAKPDDFGARPGRTTVLYPLDNDTAAAGRILSISAVELPKGSASELTISPDGQTIQVRLPDDASGVSRFEYFIDDGRAGVSAHAQVSVAARGEDANQSPALRAGFKPKVWPIPAGGVLDLPVLPDWRDKRDGDSLLLSSAKVAGTAAAGALARTTVTGRLRFTAPTTPGEVQVDYEVTDGRSDPVPAQLNFKVLNPLSDEAVAPQAEPDVVSAEVGKWVTIRPLANDLPGADPLTPRASLRLAGRIAAVGGAQVRTDLGDGTITFRADAAKAYSLEYDAEYGTAPLARGKIRVNVHPKESRDPVAMPDTTTIFGQAPVLVDVLANDSDPTGGLLVVQSARADVAGQLDLAVVEGRWVRINARDGQLPPGPHLVRYTISNGGRTAIGEITLTQRDLPADNAPVTEVDQVTVRAGSSVSIPVLDNDFSPAGDALGLVADVAGERAGQLTVRSGGGTSGPTGQAFVAGRLVRYAAPRELDDPESFDVRYIATNAAGETATGRIEISVIPASRPNRAPEPQIIEGRVVAGGTITLKLPGAGVDPDGDAVTLLGLASAPRVGRVVKFGANSIVYQAYPGTSGTDEFDYSLTDSLGGVATGSVRVAVAQAGPTQTPLAVPDVLTVEPGRTATVDVLSNDLVPAGERVSIELVDPPPGVTLESDTGPLLIEAPEKADGRNVVVVYSISNGLARSASTATVRTAAPFNNPPVVFDAFGASSDSATVRVDVLSSAYDPDGPSEELRITDVFTPRGSTASLSRGRITLARGDTPMVVPFRVEDADGGAAMAQLYVPATGTGLPYVKPDALISLAAGETLKARLSDYIVNPAGGGVRLTVARRVVGSPIASVNSAATTSGGFTVTASKGYAGPGAVTVEVTNQADESAPGAQKVVLSIPVQVGDAKPILRCPTDTVDIAQGASLELDIATLCHVWTADPRDLAELTYTADWQRSSDGLAIIEPSGSLIVVGADATAPVGSEGLLLVSAQGSAPGRLRIRVSEAGPPTLAPIQISDMRAGESRTVDLGRYLSSTAPNPVPTFVSATRSTSIDATVSAAGGSRVTISVGPKASGRAEFRITMSDTTATSKTGRQATNVLSLEVLGVPDAPGAPIPGSAVRNGEVHLDWRAPAANGGPIDYYEVRSNTGATVRCPSTSCDMTGLTNGKTYTFTVRAHNAIGWSDYSARSRGATPDAVPGAVGPIKLVKTFDGALTIRWLPPTTKTSPVREYRISFDGRTAVSRGTEFDATGLDNKRTYRFTVVPVNAQGAGPPRQSGPYQSSGPPGVPEQPTINEAAVLNPNGTVDLTVTWPVVEANGGNQVYYTVLHNGSPVPACTVISGTTCPYPGVAYDGNTHKFSVKSSSGRDQSAAGPVATWIAVAKPEAWGSWTLEPTGLNNQAQATFTVPDSRGAESTVVIYVDGQATDTQTRRGAEAPKFSVGDNDGPHTVKLELCNENECTMSSAQSVQTYGPLDAVHLVSITSLKSGNGTTIDWRIVVDGNGAPTTVTVTSNRRPDVSFSVSEVDKKTVLLGELDLGFSVTERIQVTLSDAALGRGSVMDTAAVTTDDPPPEEVIVSRGAKCNDTPGSSEPPCHTGPGDDCTDASCGFVKLQLSNFLGPVTCSVSLQGAGAPQDVGPFGDNDTHVTALYYGNSGGNVTADCTAGARHDFDGYAWP